MNKEGGSRGVLNRLPTGYGISFEIRRGQRKVGLNRLPTGYKKKTVQRSLRRLPGSAARRV